jgi:hypothetical protein
LFLGHLATKLLYGAARAVDDGLSGFLFVDRQVRPPARLALSRDASALTLEAPHEAHVAGTAHVITIEPGRRDGLILLGGCCP